jgi:alpha-D-ribose 1-methylphosphonate 5-triphosphate diphosphatase
MRPLMEHDMIDDADLPGEVASDRLSAERVILADGRVVPATLSIEKGQIVEIAEGEVPGATALGPVLLAPGLVDFHGDAFERQLMPRPGVMFDVGVAMLETDRQLIANGITTAFHGLTWSWEPGLRSLRTGKAVIDMLERAGPVLAADHRIHVRYEIFNLDGLDLLLELIGGGRVGLVAFNDHTPVMAEGASKPTANIGYAHRAQTTREAFNELALGAHARSAEVEPGIQRLAAACRQAGIAMLSHDDASPEERARYRALGARLCEFPKNRETARDARRHGEPVIMGSPNILRGRSHLGWLSALEAVEADLCTVLASDYYYPAMLQAPFRLAAQGVLPIAEAWRLVAEHPAAAAGLGDRGAIATGRRADLIAIAETDGPAPRVVAAWRQGRRVYCDGTVGSG